MPRMSAFLLVAFAVVLTPALAIAQTQTTQQEPIDPQLKADILHLLELTHSLERAQTGIRAGFELMRPHLIASLPEMPNRDKIVADYGDRLSALPQSPAFIDGLVAIYARYFSDDDIKALAQFYDTPAGQHFNQRSDDIAKDSMQLGQQLAAANMTTVVAQVCRDYPELQNRPHFCPGSEDGKSQVSTDPGRN